MLHCFNFWVDLNKHLFLHQFLQPGCPRIWPGNFKSIEIQTSWAFVRERLWPPHLRAPGPCVRQGQLQRPADVPPRFNVTITAYALGEMFNEPWPPILMTSGSMDPKTLPYPSDQLEFPVEVGIYSPLPLYQLDFRWKTWLERPKGWTRWPWHDVLWGAQNEQTSALLCGSALLFSDAIAGWRIWAAAA